VVDRAREAALVDRMRAAAAARGKAVVGLAPTLAALNERRVERLLVSDGYEEEGWRCPVSGVLAAVGPRSPVTGGRMDRVVDVVEDAIDLALNQGCKVDICVGNADLDVVGRIGALLRY
jgi:peptide subunit release factor 1 (eRF1)